jgi:citrate lyase subunit beta/citryl-CoA lyase
VVHPDQIEQGNKIFSPAPELVARAQRIMEAYDQATSSAGGFTGAIEVNQEMVDEAGVKLAATLLARVHP